jgi:hypothetical protein
MSQVILNRQYWMATLKDWHCCQICGELAISALECLDKNGMCQSVSWFCDQHLLAVAYSEIEGFSLWT